MIKGKIYKISIPDSPYYYIGQTKGRLDHRLRDHKAEAKRGTKTKFYDWLRDRVPNNSLTIEQVDSATNQDALDQKEINHINLSDPYCLNTLRGGLGTRDGENSPVAKLSDDDCNAICDFYISGQNTIKELSKMFKVSQRHIRSILTGESRDNGNRPNLQTTLRHPEKRKKATKLRVFASQHKDWSGKSISEHFGISPKHGRMILRNQCSRDPNWDPETWEFDY